MSPLRAGAVVLAVLLWSAGVAGCRGASAPATAPPIAPAPTIVSTPPSAPTPSASKPSARPRAAPRAVIVQSGERVLEISLDSATVREVLRAPPDLVFPGEYYPAYTASPDGTRLAYGCGDDGSYQRAASAVCLTGPDGSLAPPVVQPDDLERPGQLVPAQGSTTAFGWSPDGRRIAFHVRPHPLQPDRYPSDVYVYDFDSGSTRRVLDGGVDERWGAVTWSPDGARLAAQRLPDGPASELVLVDVTTGDRVDAAARLRLQAVQTNVSWSPDGAAIAFVGWDGDGPSSVYVASRDGTARKVADDQRAYWEPMVWSPDGEWIAVSLGDGTPPDPNAPFSNSRVYAVRADGTERRALGDGITESSYPAWAPDGQHLVLSGSEADGSGLFVVSLSGGEARPIGRRTKTSYPWLVAWTPDATRVLLTVGGVCFRGGCAGGRLYLAEVDGDPAPREIASVPIDRVLGWRL
ncbi:MAG: hypothetical protein WEC75_05345 [Dehalococcoidia bacterium]